MSILTRRTLLSGAASLLAGLSPVCAQWGGRTDTGDDGFYDTRGGGRMPSGARRQRRPVQVIEGDPESSIGSPYGTPVEDGYPYDTRPTVDPFGRREAEPASRRPALAAQAGELDYPRIYAAQPGESFPVPAIRWSAFNPAFLRQPVAYRGSEAPGTIVIDPRAHLLTFVEGGGRGMRYGVGVGKQGFSWAGDATINSKQEWPDWYPPKEMLERQPALARQMSQLRSGVGMAGGSRNPLGARAMYLWQGNKDTLFRIHGTTEPFSIGKSVSSGCIRMINQDAIDLYGRVAVGARVVVLG